MTDLTSALLQQARQDDADTRPQVLYGTVVNPLPLTVILDTEQTAVEVRQLQSAGVYAGARVMVQVTSSDRIVTGVVGSYVGGPGGGIPGPPGEDGNTILNGPVAPSNALGRNGDFYINTTTWTIYGPKAGGAWPAGVSLIGPKGDPGDPGAPAGGPQTWSGSSVTRTLTGTSGTWTTENDLDNFDGGTPAAALDDFDGGSPSTPLGDFDGGAP